MLSLVAVAVDRWSPSRQRGRQYGRTIHVEPAAGARNPNSTQARGATDAAAGGAGGQRTEWWEQARPQTGAGKAGRRLARRPSKKGGGWNSLAHRPCKCQKITLPQALRVNRFSMRLSRLSEVVVKCVCVIPFIKRAERGRHTPHNNESTPVDPLRHVGIVSSTEAPKLNN